MGGFFGGGASVANMVGATSSAAGTEGLVPQPAAGKQNSVLMGDATFLNLDKIQMLPDQVSNCVLWLRSDDLVTSGSNVTTWNNRVNSSKNAGQATASQQPTLQTNQINGYGAVRFDGTNDLMTISSFDLRPEITIFVVLKNLTSGKEFFIEHSPNAVTNDGLYFYGTSTASFYVRRNSAGVGRNGVNSWSGTSWGIAMARTDSSVWSFFVTWNGTPIGLFDNPSTANHVVNNSTVTNTLHIGARSGGSIPCNTDFAEIIIYNRPLFDFEISCINNYLKNRYAL